MNQFKELRNKNITQQKRIKDNAFKFAKFEQSRSFQYIDLKKKVDQATGEQKIKLQNELEQKQKQSLIHLFHSVYNRKYSDSNKYCWSHNKIEIIMDYDFPLK